MSTSEMVNFGDLFQKIVELFPDQDHQNLAGQVSPLCQIGSGVTEISKAQYDQGLKLLTMVHNGEAPTVSEAYQQLLGEVTEITTPPAPTGSSHQLIDAMTTEQAPVIAERLVDLSADVGDELEEAYLKSLFAKLPDAMRAAAAKKRRSRSVSASDRLRQYFGASGDSDGPPALPPSQD